MKIAKVILVLFFTLPFGTAHADQNGEKNDVNNLLESCDLTMRLVSGSESLSKVESSRSGFCIGFMSAIRDVLTIGCMIHRQVSPNTVSSGLRADTSGVQTRAIIQSFINEARGAPESWNDDAVFLALEATSATWPCE